MTRMLGMPPPGDRTAKAGVATGARRRHWRWGRSLSGRLLRLTVLFALGAQVAVYAPILAAQHQDLLRSRIAAAQTAVLAQQETQNNSVSPRLRKELLANAGVKMVALKREDERLLLVDENIPGPVSKVYDLRNQSFWTELGDALEALLGKGDRMVRIIDTPRLGGGQYIEAVADEKPIHDELVAFAWRTLLTGIAIALATGALVFVTLSLVLVRPIRRLIGSMTVFSERPDDPARVLEPSGRRDEIGAAEKALARMQGDVRAALGQRAHLAAMGAAVAKINHDLRNMLSGAQIASESLGESQDPNVRRMAPRLLRTLDRAIALATDTLAYGKAGERAPVRSAVDLHAIAQDAAVSAGAPDHARVDFANRIVPGCTAVVDGEHLYRILLNLMRNAVQAIEACGLTAALNVESRQANGALIVEITDTGPGIPVAILPSLFEPFGGSAKITGTGLGLAIARELARNHGGDLELAETRPGRTCFRLTLPGASGESRA